MHPLERWNLPLCGLEAPIECLSSGLGILADVLSPTDVVEAYDHSDLEPATSEACHGCHLFDKRSQSAHYNVLLLYCTAPCRALREIMANFSDKGSLPPALSIVSYSLPRLDIHLTQQQEHALYTLNDEDDRDICAYLRFAASTGGDLRPSSDPAALPKAKVHAIEALKNLPVDVLLAWLQTTRHPGK